MNIIKYVTIGALALLTIWVISMKRYERQPQARTIPFDQQAMKQFKKPDSNELKHQLSAEQFAVTQQCGTEPPFRNAYWDNHEPGIYVDVVSGEPLFSSLQKFDSGSGWPSFTQPLKGTEIVEKKDAQHGMVRTEVRSQVADSHLGHVFDDGPADQGGMRYCINSAALRFIPVEEMDQSGYSDYLAPFVQAGIIDAPVHETAILAGGCFWGMEEIIRGIPGVINTTVGYIGGEVKNPLYEQICTDTTGHAEAVSIVFDPSKISFEALLGYFFRLHDPTTLNRQHNDVGSQYRSAIFYTSDAQKQIAEKVIGEVNQSGKWKNPVVTKVSEAKEFYDAESYHQDYLQKNPGGYNCHYLRD